MNEPADKMNESADKMNEPAGKLESVIIVLDLDFTLICAIDKESYDTVGVPSDMSFDGHYVYVRPGAIDFVSKLRKSFGKVGIWSFGNDYYVNGVVEELTKRGCIFDFVHSHDNAPNGGKQTAPCKILTHIDKRYNGISFIVDDSHHTCAYNPGKSVHIRQYKIEIAEDIKIDSKCTVCIDGSAEYFRNMIDESIKKGEKDLTPEDQSFVKRLYGAIDHAGCLECAYKKILLKTGALKE